MVVIKRSHDGTLVGDGGAAWARVSLKPSHEEANSDSALEDVGRNSTIDEYDSNDASTPAEDSIAESDDDPSDVSASEPDVLSFAEIKERLLDAIDNITIHPAGAAATSGLLPKAANPGIYVDGLGGVGLPLSEHDAYRLARRSSRLPLGAPFKDSVETYQGNIWELSSSSFEMRNPAWELTLNAAMVKAADSLGIAFGAARMRAEHCRLRLYGRGSSSGGRMNFSQDVRNLGTLVIALPSAHTGGAVTTHFDSNTLLSYTAPSSSHDFSYVAWYTDVEHTVQEVSSGYRFVLIYDLVQQVSGRCQRAAHLGPRVLASGIRQDWAKAHCLKQVCDTNGFSLFLANIEQAIPGAIEDSYGYDDYDDNDGMYDNHHDEHHSIIEEDGRTLELTIVALGDGSAFAKEVDFAMDNMLQAEPFDGAEPDKEDTFDTSTMRYYRRSVLLVMPKESEDHMLFESALKSTDEAREFLNGLLKPVQDVKLKRIITVSRASLHECQIRLERFCKQLMDGRV
ncbi:hypothetical protein MMC26_005934 [Xylographa opegraphella]|nr:hypothetical protein [Xylographa opegraphella]